MYRQFYNCCILSNLSQKQQKRQKRKFLKICVFRHTSKQIPTFIKTTETKLENTFWGSCQIVVLFFSETVLLVFGTMQFCMTFVSELVVCQLSFLARQVRFKTSITGNTAHSCNGKVIDITRQMYRNTTGISGLITNLTVAK